MLRIEFSGWLRARSTGCAAVIFALALVWPQIAVAQTPAATEQAAIASAHPLATRAGHDVLKRGGNAFDAAIAVAAALAVVEPYSSGLGGGGFWLLHRARDGHQIMVDSREVAPSAASPGLFFDAEGKPVPGATRRGGKSVAVPGVPAALVHIAEHYGNLPLSVSLGPAIHYARDGFAVGSRYARIAERREGLLQKRPATARTFLDNDRVPQPGFLLRQPALAQTMQGIATDGRDGFYRGAVAQALVEAVNRAGGVWQLEDLERYRVVERTPLRIRYHGATITTVTLPSAGGIALAQVLQMLERFELSDARAPRDAHLVIEALRRAFQDRSLYLGDDDFVAVPMRRLLSREYAARRAANIDPMKATKSDEMGNKQSIAPASGNTTHLSVIDGEGNRVAATLSINLLFGSGIVAAGTGVLLNNEMDDFSLQADLPNAFRLRGGAANAVGPGKRPLSSMTPAFVEDEKGILIIGAPGGSRIVSQLLLAVLDYVGSTTVDLAQIVSAPRYHHQWWPDRVEIEMDSFTPDWRASLEAKGHRLRMVGRKWGNMQAVLKSKTDGAVQAANDPRGAGVAWY
ncbi:MAG: gamma-glutamyltransferase [Betaproteobacteria bacterium]|nr:gamma-glutamyltransferase [Betaproteobacteria bacterium]MDH3438119.1 gamma-glutamyltransferase [Betaproteobacteria bacterium]